MSTEVSSATDSIQRRYTLRLHEAAGAGASGIGSKAANLANLTGTGLPVPDGFVLRVNAFHRFCEANPGLDHRRPLSYDSLTIPSDLKTEIGVIAAQLMDCPLAVRSSASDEDLPDASYAGQYDTVLNVVGLEAIEQAVVQCWMSAFNDRVLTYRARRGEEGVPAVAVLIQPLIDADCAGVAFTANPITRKRDETMVSAIHGLGERLVSGEVTPDEWIVRNDIAEPVSTPGSVLTADQVRQIAGLARLVESHLKTPQDIEWAIAGDSLYLLQARPITTLGDVEPVEPEIEIPEGFWMRDLEHFPRPISPISRSFYLSEIASAMSAGLTEFGILLDRVEARAIAGYAYLRMVPPGGKEGPSPPWWLLRVLLHLLPSTRKLIRNAREAEQNDLETQLIDQWWNTWRPEFFERIDARQAVDLQSLADSALIKELQRRRELLRDGNRIHFRLLVPFMKPVAELAIFCEEELGWDSPKTMDLLSGLSPMSTEPARKLADLAEMARQRPAVREILLGSSVFRFAEIRNTDPEFAGALDAHQKRFGIRLLGEDLIEPTLGEHPEITLDLLRSHLDGSYDPNAIVRELARSREALLDEARGKLHDRPDAMSRFNRLVQRAQRAYPVREDNSFPTYQAPLGLVRYALLEVGRRMTERGALAEAEDVMFLEFDEFLEFFRTGRDAQAIVRTRRAERAWTMANPAPPLLGEDPGPPPDLRAIPAEARAIMKVLVWSMEIEMAPPPSPEAGFGGLPGSPGTYRGPARIVHSEFDFHKILPGDVLVCPITSPVWSVLFSSIGALVTDTGGVLSHSAIVAREHGIPAVVATGTATSTLRDGQIVTVDGNSGTVDPG